MPTDDFDDFHDGEYWEDFDENFEPENIDEENDYEIDEHSERYPLSKWQDMAVLGGMAEELADIRKAQYKNKREENSFHGYKRKPDEPNVVQQTQKKSPYGDLIYIDSRGVGVPPTSRVITITEAIERGYPVLIDYIDNKGNYFKSTKIRPKNLFARNGYIYIVTIKNRVLNLANVYFLAPLFGEKSIPVKNPNTDTSHSPAQGEHVKLFYFVPNYDYEPFEYTIEKLENLSKKNLNNPSQEIITLCKQIKAEKWQPQPQFKNYKLLLDAICEDIRCKNPELDPSIPMTIKVDESPPDDPGLSIELEFKIGKSDESEETVILKEVEDTEDPIDLMVKGKALFEDGKIVEAIRFFDNLCYQDFPFLSDVFYYKGLLYLEVKKPDLALAEIEHALEIEPNYCEALCARAQIFISSLYYNCAFEDIQKVLRLERDQESIAEAYWLHGNAFFRMKDYKQALYSFDESIKFNNSIGKYYFSRGMTCLKLMHIDDAIEDFIFAKEDDCLSSINKRPSVKERCYLIYYFSAIANQLKNDFDSAFDYYSQALLLDECINSMLYVMRGIAYYSLGKTGNALSDFNQAILLDSKKNMAEAYYCRGLMFETIGKEKEAAEDFNTATNIKPYLMEKKPNLDIVEINPFFL